MHHFTLVTTDNEVVGVFTYVKCDWKPGDIIPQGSASLRVVDVIPADPLDGVKVGLLKVEPAEL
jgi:hypothetical protein